MHPRAARRTLGGAGARPRAPCGDHPRPVAAPPGKDTDVPNPRAALRAVLLLPACTAVLAVAACGTTAPPSAPPTVSAGPVASPAPSPAAPATRSPAAASPTATRPVAPVAGSPAEDRCRTGELDLVLGPVDAGAGQRRGTVVLQNRGARRCSLTGFGGLELLDAAGRPLPVALTRVGPPPRTVTFGPRSDQIDKVISWTVVPGDGGCVEPATVVVTPPDETTSLRAPWTYGPVCGGRIDGHAYGVG